MRHVTGFVLMLATAAMGPAIGSVDGRAHAPTPASSEEGCKVCLSMDVPSGPGAHGTSWDPLPQGWQGTVAWLNPGQKNGQCPPPESCSKDPCKYWGTLQIHNTGGSNLLNAQISVGGVLVSASGPLNIGGKRAKTYTKDNPLEIECGNNKEIEFSITTNGPAVLNNLITMNCGACGG